MATVTPNFNWPVPTSTDLVKDGATAIEALGDSIDASLVDLKGGTTGQVLSKTSGTDMDFTWVTSDDANAIQNSIVNAKGDLITATANDTPSIISVGANGETLVADSSTATGLKWKQQGLTLVSRVTFSNVASQIFDNVFTTSYKSYKIVIDTIYAATGSDDLQMQWRYGTTTQTTEYYAGFASVNYLGTQTLSGQSNTAQHTLMANCGSSSDGNTAEFTVGQVGIAAKPQYHGHGWDWPLTGYYTFGGGNNAVATYSGFLLKSSSSNITGTVSIYGYGS